MGRLYTLFKWEVEDAIKNVLLFFGIVLIGLAMKESLMMVTQTSPGGFGLLTEILRKWRYGTYLVASSINSELALSDVWYLMSFIILLLGALTFRYDRDSGVAFSVYSLPYSNTEIFTIKLLSFLLYSFLLATVPFIYITITSYAGISRHLPDITSSFLVLALILLTFGILYITSIATLVSLLSPNAFLAVIVGFAVIYASKILGMSGIPLQLFIDAIYRCGSSDFAITAPSYLGWGLAFPLLLFTASLLLVRRRDVA
ncbi:hypothetical protein JCM16138_12840 [Thermococcus atlanticus]